MLCTSDSEKESRVGSSSSTRPAAIASSAAIAAVNVAGLNPWLTASRTRSFSFADFQAVVKPWTSRAAARLCFPSSRR